MNPSGLFFAMKKALKWIGIILLVYLGYNWELVLYGLRQGAGQYKIITEAKPIEEVLADPVFPDSLKLKIELIQEVRKFAVSELGLADSENYTTLYDQKGQAILWVVEACPEFSLEPYKWSFPILGDLAYKGFFEKELAENEAQRLSDLGFETDLGTVSGWSTLGWFSDPILSNMLYRSDARLAELIIHELTHASMYVKGDDRLNENIATLIGRKGAERFLASDTLRFAEELHKYQASMHDKKLYSAHLNRGVKRLDSLYSALEAIEELSKKRSLKTALIHEVFDDADSISFQRASSYTFLKRRDTIPNNVYFTGFQQYNALQDSLELVFEENYNANVLLFIEAMIEEHGTVSK